MAGGRSTRTLTLAVAAALFVVVFVLRLVVADPVEPILFLLVVPVGLVAADAGPVPGLVGAVFASGLVVLWELIEDPHLTWIGYATRFGVFFVTAVGVGYLAQTRRELEAETARWFDTSIDLNCVADLEGNFVRVNRAFEETLGFSARDLVETPYVARVHPDDRKDTNAVASELARGAHVVDFENRYQAADGTYRWLRWSASSDPVSGRIYASARDVTILKDLEDELRSRAQKDGLTDLPNRRHFEEESRRQLDFLRRYGPGGALVMIDVDDFKAINDGLGHAAGDDVLRMVAASIRNRIRGTDIAGRIGGDEFAILFPGVTPADAGHIVDSLLAGFHARGPAGTQVGLSAGVAIFAGQDAPSLEELLAVADQAMYAAKRAGGSGHVISSTTALGGRPT